MGESIFSFGTLQTAAVQQSLFGRSVPTTPDSLHGWRVGQIRITDPDGSPDQSPRSTSRY